jgi:hypothetical protein
MARGNDERNNPNRRVDQSRLQFVMATHGLVLNKTNPNVDPEDAYLEAAYLELVDKKMVPLRDLPIEDHPDFRKIILPHAEEMMRRDAEEVHQTAMQDDAETREERRERLGGESDDYESGR